MKRLVILGLSTTAAAGALTGWMYFSEAPPPPVVEQRRTGDIELAPDSNLITGVIPSRTTLGGMLQEYAVLDSERLALVSAVRSVFDVRRVREGQPFAVDRMLDGRVRSFEYEIDGDRRLVVRAAQELRNLRVPLIGIVANRVESGGSDGYFGYGYGYGYGDDDTDEPTSEDIVRYRKAA